MGVVYAVRQTRGIPPFRAAMSGGVKALVPRVALTDFPNLTSTAKPFATFLCRCEEEIALHNSLLANGGIVLIGFIVHLAQHGMPDVHRCRPSASRAG